ncbi:MAG TPA: hypothetical protein VLM89_17040, partial [Phycisphaerae bacterium]|nr:hypothetical protein [Phycisphaerae bacterium]
PAALARLYDSYGYRGTTSSDAIFNHSFDQGGGTWETDIQDSVDGQEFGRDAMGNDVDLVLRYKVSSREKFAPVTISRTESGWSFDVYTYDNKLIWKNAAAGNGPVVMPIMWMSFGANASAGLRNVKGSPALIVESCKPGVFPESFVRAGGSGGVIAEDLSRVLRFRHGNRVQKPELTGYDYTRPGAIGFYPDRGYQPRDRMNVGYLDGHIERQKYWEVMTLAPPGKPVPRQQVWFGLRQGGTITFD